MNCQSVKKQKVFKNLIQEKTILNEENTGEPERNQDPSELQPDLEPLIVICVLMLSLHCDAAAGSIFS